MLGPLCKRAPQGPPVDLKRENSLAKLSMLSMVALAWIPAPLAIAARSASLAVWLEGPPRLPYKCSLSKTTTQRFFGLYAPTTGRTLGASNKPPSVSRARLGRLGSAL